MGSISASLAARRFCGAMVLVACACGGGDADVDAGGDAGAADAGPTPIPTLDHCAFEAAAPTGGAGGTVAAGELTAGTAEALLDVPLGASLAAYTARSEGAGRDGFIDSPRDGRHTYLAGSFAPAVGIETIPRIRGLALTAGGETVVILKIDLASSYQGFVHDVEERLGPEFSGKVIVSASHSHSSFGNYSGHSALAVGFGQRRSSVYAPVVDQLHAVAVAALAARRPARIGFAYDGNFDPEDRVSEDRRSDNDDLAGGPEKDHHLFVVRVDDAVSGAPIALVPVFGIHGTIHDANNAIVSTDATGGIERVLEETFDSDVLVMHLQGAAGDVSPAGHESIDCQGSEVCTDFARAESIGLYARDAIRAAWEDAGRSMQREIAIESLTRTVPLGPDYRTFAIRNGGLRYAEWNLRRTADGVVYDGNGAIVSPIDEFNAPFGAALCTPDMPALNPRAQMPGTVDLAFPYRGCLRLEIVDTVFESLIDIELEEPPFCETTRTTVTALRLGDWLIGTLPGEPTTQLVDHLRTLSPVDPDKTIVLGYAQNHGGYLMQPEDWLRGGYEPTITFWGPLEGEYVAEQLAALLPLATTPEREDGNADGMPRVDTPLVVDPFPRDTLAIAPGTIPETLPSYILTRLLRPVTSAQPASEVPRLATAYFTWVGEDPLDGTPRVFLERREGDQWIEVRRRSGRPVQDGDLVLTWTPDPIEPIEGTPRVHHYTVEFETVAPLGTVELDRLEQRMNLPLGSYRFRVEGARGAYTIVSGPFEVVAGTLAATRMTRGTNVDVTVGYEHRDNFRLIDLGTRSNRFVPVRDRLLTVTVDGVPVNGVRTDANGRATIPNAAEATSIAIADEFGNRAVLGR